MNAERAVFVYTTYPSVVEAEEAGRALVERRLCACVNILPPHDLALLVERGGGAGLDRVKSEWSSGQGLPRN